MYRDTHPLAFPLTGPYSVQKVVMDTNGEPGGVSKLVGYARVSTSEQDLQPQLDALGRLGVDPRRIYLDKGLTGKNRERPGLREALAACHAGSTLVVTKLDRLGRSITDLRDIAHELEERGVLLSLDGQVYDPTTPFGRLVFNVFAMMAEFEGDLISQRTIEGMATAKARGRLKGKQPKLSKKQDAALLKMYDDDDQSVGELGHLFGISRTSAYRAIARGRASQVAPIATNSTE